MADWLELNQGVRLAFKAGDFARAEQLLDEAWAAAKRRDDRELICNTCFAEGMLRDAQDRLDDAERAFHEALAIDRALHGGRHTRVADTLHSIGIVRNRRGDREGALAAFREAAAIFEVERPFLLANELTTVGGILMELERYDDALAS